MVGQTCCVLPEFETQPITCHFTGWCNDETVIPRSARGLGGFDHSMLCKIALRKTLRGKKTSLQEVKQFWPLRRIKFTFLALKSYIVFEQFILLASVGGLV